MCIRDRDYSYDKDKKEFFYKGKEAKKVKIINRIKPDNEQIYYIIDAINEAINAGKQISFQYYDYTGLKKKVLKNKGSL